MECLHVPAAVPSELSSFVCKMILLDDVAAAAATKRHATYMALSAFLFETE